MERIQLVQSSRPYPCRWVACQENFDAYPAFVDHVLGDHISSISPEKMTIDVSDITKRKGHGSQFLDDIHSSLPSPPVSSPLSLLSAAYSPQHNKISFPSPRSSLENLREHGSPNSSSPDLELPDNSRPPPTPSMENQYSGFGSMSSPILTTSGDEPLHLLRSPSFSSLVERDVTAKRRELSHSDSISSNFLSRAVKPMSQMISSSSPSSQGSQDSVEMQLTQSIYDDNEISMDTDVTQGDLTESQTQAVYSNAEQPGSAAHHQPHPNNLLPDSSCAQNIFQFSQSSQPPSQFQLQDLPQLQADAVSLDSQVDPNPISNGGFAVSTPVPRQAWYQPSFPRISCPQSRPISTQSSPQPQSSNYPLGKTFRSGTLQISPSKRSKQPAVEPSETQSQTLSEGDWPLSQERYEYPPLQTQAPYYSQCSNQT